LKKNSVCSFPCDSQYRPSTRSSIVEAQELELHANLNRQNSRSIKIQRTMTDGTKPNSQTVKHPVAFFHASTHFVPSSKIYQTSSAHTPRLNSKNFNFTSPFSLSQFHSYLSLSPPPESRSHSMFIFLKEQFSKSLINVAVQEVGCYLLISPSLRSN